MKKEKKVWIGTRHRFGPLAFFALLLALVAAPASAYETHLPLPFSPITGAGSGVTIDIAGDVAVDASSGNVFLAEPRGPGSSTISIFGGEGGPPNGLASPYQLSGLNLIDSRVFETSLAYSHIAVDNSTESPNKGTLYVSEFGAAASSRKVKKFIRNGTTEKYEAAGELKATFVINGSNKPFENPAGIAFDAKGNVFVADASSNIGAIARFNSAGTQTGVIYLDNLTTGSNSYVPRSLAVDSAGDLFVLVERVGNPENPSTKVVKYPADELGQIDEDVFEAFYVNPVGGGTGNDAYDIAVDQSSDTLYLALRNRVIQYDAITLAEEGAFGVGAFEGSIRIAGLTVNEANGSIYVSDNGPFHGGPRKITVFGPGVKLPTVTPKPATEVIAGKATLNATVNPTGIPLDDCHFEYVDDAQYKADGETFDTAVSVPCEAAVPADEDDHPVTAKLTGLIPGGVVYHWRISATNVNGVNASAVQSFASGPPALTEAATNVTGARATLNGVVLPQNNVVTECRFEYGTTLAYGSSVPCEGAIPADEGEHPVSAEVDDLLANGTTYHFRIATDGGAGQVQGNDETLETAETFVTNPASELTATTARLNGTVNLEDIPLTGCRFEYGLTDSFGSSAPCVPSFSSIPVDSAPHLVSAEVSGLDSNATYQFRLVAENPIGDGMSPPRQVVSATRAFKSGGPPLIKEQSAYPAGVAAGLLEGYVDPVGMPATYHFEWGTDQSYGSRVPLGSDPEISAGTGSVRVAEGLSGLTENTTYHFRLVATNEVGTTKGPDQTFTTARFAASCSNAEIRAGQISTANPVGTDYLPDCMALEMVSPPKKFNQRIDSPNFSASGDALQFISLAALAETPQLGSQNDPYVATRAASGWVTHAVQPPPGVSLGDAPPCSYDLSLSRWSLLARPGQGAESLGIVEPMSGGLGAPFSALGPVVRPLNTTFDYAGCESSPGGSADGSAFFFRAEGASYLPGDPITTAKATGSSSNTYEAHLGSGGTPAVELLSRDAGGTVYGGTCGADVGWLGTGDRRAGRGAISPEGSRVYFSTRPSQGPGACQPGVNKLRIMKRVQAPAGPEIGQLFSSECVRVAPACDTTDGDDNFMAASQEGDRVFFTTTRQLADSDRDTGGSCQAAGSRAGCDLYLYDANLPAGSRLIQVSAGESSAPTPGEGAEVLGVGDVSGDGSRAYFVASGLLTTSANAQGASAEAGEPNLYLYERDAADPDGHVVFIATLAPGEGNLLEGAGRNAMAAVPRLGDNPEDLSVGGDGHVFFFSTKSKLLPGDEDAVLDGYRYNADTGSLERITRAAPGGSDNGAFAADGMFTSGEGRAPQDVSFRRTVSEDGRTAVFMTAEALDPRDGDGGPDVYIWRDGQVTSISGSLADKRGETFTVTMSGQAVAFVTDQQLLPTDGDGAKDIYVARSAGGFPPPPPPDECEGERCREPFQDQPLAENPQSATFADSGTPPSPAKCKKGFVRNKKGKCVKKPRHGKGKHGKAGHGKKTGKKTQKGKAKDNRRAGK